MLRLHVPAPQCRALTSMAQVPVWQTVFSVPNLDSFTNYIAYYATQAEVEELVQLPVVYHRGNWDGIATRIPIGVVVNNTWLPLPEADCTLENCPRCSIGRSGYAFYWVDARWTPEAALDLSQSMMEMQEESERPWPRGILREPLPQNAAHAPRFLTTEWDLPVDLWDR